MKLKFLFIALVILSSCSSGKEETLKVADFSADDFPMEYELTIYSTMLVGSQVTGDDLPYREKFVFREDQTFTKTRTENGQTYRAEGNYNLASIGEEDYFRLTYDSANELVENCSGADDTENLIIDSPSKIRGTANACDYPSKTYERVK